MNAPLKAVAGSTKLEVTMRNLGREARGGGPRTRARTDSAEEPRTGRHG